MRPNSAFLPSSSPPLFPRPSSSSRRNEMREGRTGPADGQRGGGGSEINLVALIKLLLAPAPFPLLPLLFLRPRAREAERERERERERRTERGLQQRRVEEKTEEELAETVGLWSLRAWLDGCLHTIGQTHTFRIPHHFFLS